MGFKLSLFSIYDGEPGYFGKSPQPDLVKTIKLAQVLPFRLSGKKYLKDLEIWPSNSLVGLGVFEHGAIVIHRSLDCLKAQNHTITTEMFKLFPKGSFLALNLHSVVNYFGYTLIENNKLIRSYSGAEDHIDSDIGELLPEEKNHFEKSYVENGMRYFKSDEFPDEDFIAPAYGEELVMDLSIRLFGKTLNDIDFPPLNIFYFVTKPWYRFW